MPPKACLATWGRFTPISTCIQGNPAYSSRSAGFPWNPSWTQCRWPPQARWPGHLQNAPGTPAMHFPLAAAGSQSALYKQGGRGVASCALLGTYEPRYGGRRRRWQCLSQGLIGLRRPSSRDDRHRKSESEVSVVWPEVLLTMTSEKRSAWGRACPMAPPATPRIPPRHPRALLP